MIHSRPAAALRAASRLLCLAIFTAGVASQQPNSAAATMTIGGAAGPPTPIVTTVRTSANATFALAGSAGAPLLIARSATGIVQQGTLASGGGWLDLPLVPAPEVVIDGIANPQFALDPTGALAFSVPVPPAGSPPGGIPLGHQEALQAAIADPASPVGFTLTAATQVSVVQGPFVANLSLGSDGAALIDVGAHGFSIPFYGIAYTHVWICVNGFITMGLPDTDFTPSVLELNTGDPRLAPFWADLDQYQGGIVRTTIDPNPAGGQPPFILAEWIGVTDWGNSFAHTFSAYADASGFCRLSYSILNSPSLYNTLCGIGPGSGLNPQASKDLSVLRASGGLAGAPQESFFEVFIGLGIYQGPGAPPPPNPYDLFGATLNFLPSGSGGLPASTSAYFFY